MRIDPPVDGFTPVLTDTSKSTRCWEFKNANLHRGVVDILLSSQTETNELQALVRAAIHSNYTQNWFKGFAFGSVVPYATTPAQSLNVHKSFIDSFNNSKGVWQWSVAVDHPNMKVYACHMWAQGALQPYFEATVEKLRALGYSIEKEYKEKPRFFSRIESLLVKAAKAVRTLRYLQVLIVMAALLFFGIRALRDGGF